MLPLFGCLRISECLDLNWADINLKEGTTFAKGTITPAAAIPAPAPGSRE